MVTTYWVSSISHEGNVLLTLMLKHAKWEAFANVTGNMTQMFSFHTIVSWTISDKYVWFRLILHLLWALPVKHQKGTFARVMYCS